MLKRFDRNRIELSAVLCIACILLGCDGFSRIDGFVRDPDGKPISSARVELIEGDRNGEVYSGPVGEFKVGMTHAPFRVNLMLRVTKVGYKAASKKFSSGDGIREIEDILEPTTSPRESTFREVKTEPS